MLDGWEVRSYTMVPSLRPYEATMSLNHAYDRRSVSVIQKQFLIEYMYLIGVCGPVRIKEETP